MAEHTPYKTTIVSAYFQINSKFPAQKYHAWIKNFLKIKSPMVIFTDSRKLIEDNRANDFSLHIVDCQIKDFYVYKYLDKWKQNHSIDREKSKHNINLYMIWNEKSNFIKRAIEIDPFKSKYFYWTDIGAFREPQRMDQFIDYPQRVTEKVLLLQIEPFKPHEKMINPDKIKNNFYNVNRIGGGIFGGAKDYCLKWCTKYYEILDKFFKNDQFAGKDQSIMATVAILNPDLVRIVSPNGAKYDPWFYLEEWLCVKNP